MSRREFLFPVFVLALSLLLPSSFLTRSLSHATPPPAGPGPGPVSYINDPRGDLQALPEAKPILEKVIAFLNSPEARNAGADSKSLEILRGRLLTSVFHLNLKPNVVVPNYPYDPVYRDPFPKRPTLETLEEVTRLIAYFGNSSAANALKTEIEAFGPYRQFSATLQAAPAATPPAAIQKAEILAKPVDSYLAMRSRLRNQGETASFPEFYDEVQGSLAELRSPEIQAFKAKDPVFRKECDDAIAELEAVKAGKGSATAVQAEIRSAYPYRRTIQALERAVAVFDMRERLKYPESKDWHEVELSWHQGSEPKVLPLYHYNRYKYQQYGLLSNPDVVLLPWMADATQEDLIRLRSAPLGLIGVMPKTLRIDRHHNTPLDFWYHDVNHIRRMYGYDKRAAEHDGIHDVAQLEASLRKRERFVSGLLASTAPNTGNLVEDQRRALERTVIFETFHETALTATQESLLSDLRRVPNTPQPFEVQIQDPSYQLEQNRTFDGNLKSGADVLPIDLSKPTEIRYFYDRAPGFLSNNDNKIRWGFHESVFVERKDPNAIRFRTPRNLALAATRLYERLGEKAPPLRTLVSQIEDRTGQPELYNYFALNPKDDITGRLAPKREPAESILRPGVIEARKLRGAHPDLKPAELAQRVLIAPEEAKTLVWMRADLEDYLKNFDRYFDAKLSRGKKQSVAGGHAVYIDAWGVPYFNTATQTREQAKEGVEKALERLKSVKETPSYHEYADLLATYLRPEFDDVRRYKVQFFPPQPSPYAHERSDAKFVGDRFPDESFIPTTRELSMDELSFTSGRHVHYVGLVPHSSTEKADGRTFVGTADFGEHDMSHGYFGLKPALPGTEEQWKAIHEEFRSMQASVADPKQRYMNSLVYFHMLHESAYKTMVPNEDGSPPDPRALKREMNVIRNRILSEGHYAHVPREVGPDHARLLPRSFRTVTQFLAGKIAGIEKDSPASRTRCFARIVQLMIETPALRPEGKQ